MKTRTLHLVSLGCAKNFVDSENILGHFVNAGYQVVEEPYDAEVLLVNTCGFIQPAVEESIDEILGIAQVKEETGALLVVTGCMVQRYGEQLRKELPEVDLFVAIDEQPQLVRLVTTWPDTDNPSLTGAPSRMLLDSSAPRELATPPFRAFLKLTEGCDNHCSYCMIPSIRGQLRSRSINDLCREACRLEASGVRELSLIAQDLTAYGDDHRDNPGEAPTLSRLLKALLACTNIPWIRLLYLYPTRLDSRLLQLMACEPRLVPYVDVPFQHAATPVLKAMNRHYSTDDLDTLLKMIRSEYPDCAIRTTFMVGFPGETSADFSLLMECLQRWQLDHVGGFTYQDEEECRAHRFTSKVPAAVAEERLQRLMGAQAEISRTRLAQKVGQVEEVLVEGVSSESDLLLEGRLRSQAPDVDGVVYLTSGTAVPGEIRQVRITEAHTYDLVGELCEKTVG